jgi:hypothetical protein
MAALTSLSSVPTQFLKMGTLLTITGVTRTVGGLGAGATALGRHPEMARSRTGRRSRVFTRRIRMGSGVVQAS